MKETADMKTYIPGRIGRAPRKAAAVVFLSAAIFVTPQSFATDIHPEWSNEHIAALFPDPLEGWAIGELELEERETITSAFEGFVTGMTGVKMGVSIRLQASRHYVAQERIITVLVDSSDIETAASIDAIAAAHETDDDLRQELEKTGVRSISLRDHFGFSAQEADNAGLVFKIGSAGIVGMECDYRGCAADLARLMEHLGFERLSRFADFDHRK